MRFGIFSVADHYPAELRRSATELYGELLDQAEAADALGFDSFWIAEHHFHEYGAIPRPPVWLAAAAERTRRIRLYAVQRPFETLVEQNVVAFGDPDEIVRVARLYEAGALEHQDGVTSIRAARLWPLRERLEAAPAHPEGPPRMTSTDLDPSRSCVPVDTAGSRLPGPGLRATVGASRPRGELAP